MGMRLFLLQLQISAAVLVILLLRQGMKKMPKVYSYVLWLLIFARLLCPVALESRFSFMPSAEKSSAWVEQILENTPDTSGLVENTQTGSQNEWEPVAGESGNLSGSEDGIVPGESGAMSGNLSNGAVDATPGTVETNADVAAGNIRNYFPVLWFLGTIAILSYNGIALIQVRRRLRTAKALQEDMQVYTCEGINAPFTLGLVHPKIYLPANLNDEERAYILCHERVHIRRRDYLIKNLTFLLTAIYWFNPFVWIAFYFMERDMEMSCDEKVIKLMGADIKRNYSQSLLNFAEGKGGMAVTPLTFGENSVKQRVKNVLSYKNAKKWSIVLGAVILLVAVIALFTTGESGDGRDDQSLQDDQTAQGNPSKPDDSGNVSSATPAPGDEAGEIYWTADAAIYEDGESGTITIQAKPDGIYRLDGAQWTHVYPYYIYPEALWTVSDGILYFVIDSTYTETSPDYSPDTVCMLDLVTGQYDRDTLRITEAFRFIRGADYMSVFDGLINFFDMDNGQDYYISLVNTGSTAVLNGNIWNGKVVSELNEQEQNAYGAAVREQLLTNPALLQLSNRTLKETFAIVDLDGDGEAERITLSRNPEPLIDSYWTYGIFDNYRLKAGTSALTDTTGQLENNIWAFSPDGSNIVLALCNVYGGVFPQTQLFSYESGELRKLGTLPCDIRECTIGDGIILGEVEKNDFMQPCWITQQWRINATGELEWMEQETYDIFYGKFELPNLLVELPVHDTPGSAEIHYIQPQKVDFIKFDNTFQWVYLEAEDGSSGWFKIEPVNTGNGVRVKIVELDMNHYEVFELFYAG